jgi:hypothetical protein
MPRCIGLRNLPDEVRGHHRTHDGAAVAERIDQFVQMFDLQPVVQRVPETMGPVEQRQDAKHEQVKTADQAVRSPAARRSA